jgi:hypothetical protein
LSLDALAGLGGISRGKLLQIEGQRVNSNLATLVRIADVVDLWHGEHGGRRGNPGGLLRSGSR